MFVEPRSESRHILRLVRIARIPGMRANNINSQLGLLVHGIYLEWNLLPCKIGYVCGTRRMSTHLGMARRILMDDISHVGRWAEFDNLCGFLVDEEFLEDSPRDYEVPN